MSRNLDPTLTGTISIRNPLRDSLSFPSGGRSGRPRTAGRRSGFGRSAGGTQPDLRDSGIHFTNWVLMSSSKRDRRYKKIGRLGKEWQAWRRCRIDERSEGFHIKKTLHKYRISISRPFHLFVFTFYFQFIISDLYFVYHKFILAIPLKVFCLVFHDC